MRRLKELRDKLGKTQQQMATIFHVNRTTYTKWENGIHKPDTDDIKKIADYFNVTIDYLLEHADVPFPTDKKKPSHAGSTRVLRTVARLEEIDPSDKEDEMIASYIDFLLAQREKGEGSK